MADRQHGAIFSRRKNIDLLLEQRPEAKPGLLAWKGGDQLYHAVRDHEEDRSEPFERHYQDALDLFSQARTLGPESVGVAAVTGGSYVLFADRLPEPYRPAAWSDAYDSYQVLWRAQAASIDKLPVHMRGELLAGLAQSSQRTGRADESAQFLDRMLELLKNTPYERAAQRWKDDPQAAAISSIACKSCHAPGRLAARIVANENK
jgi:tetratricopeptide (TPR) repeat protein